MHESSPAEQQLIAALKQGLHPFSATQECYTKLLDKIGDANIVLLGEATHGTQEFYQIRAELTQRLIIDKGFMAIAVEGDWPDVYQINRYTQGQIDNSLQALASFKRFPSWMWCNKIIQSHIEWLQQFNQQAKEPVGFYGLDVYSLNTSIQAVIDYLQAHDSEAAERAKQRYGIFEQVGHNPQAYGYLANSGIKKSGEAAVIEQLLEFQHHAFEYCKVNGGHNIDDYFYALQNARVVKNAEAYYRAMFTSDISSWNLRDRHMMETLNALASHLEQRFKKPAKIVVWAHNSHIGDARATEMGERGELNIGQLVREQYGPSAIAIGFSTYTGTVTAADAWDGKAQCKRVKPALPGSYEDLFHQAMAPCFWLDLTHGGRLEKLLHVSRLQRAIGVIYLPQTERESHYFFTRLPYQFNAIIHIDETHALEALNIQTEMVEEEAETYPSGL
jgi:erythromycin esterase-like protein